MSYDPKRLGGQGRAVPLAENKSPKASFCHPGGGGPLAAKT